MQKHIMFLGKYKIKFKDVKNIYVRINIIYMAEAVLNLKFISFYYFFRCV